MEFENLLIVALRASSTSVSLDRAFIGGDAEFLNALPCRHYDWKPVEVSAQGCYYRTPLILGLVHPGGSL